MAEGRLQKFGRALQGFGAGVQGRGPEFIAGLRQQEQDLDENRKQALLKDAFTIQRMLQSGQISPAREIILNRLQAIEQLGGDNSDTLGLLNKFDSGDIKGVFSDVSTVVEFGIAQGRLQPQDGNQNVPAEIRTFNTLSAGLTPEDKDIATRIALGLDPRASKISTIDIGGVPHVINPNTNQLIPLNIGGQDITTATVAASESAIAGATSAATKSSAEQETRRATRIIVGSDAANAIPTLRRSLELLETVKTGGVNAVSLAVRQKLGVESADAGELSQKLGKAVLSQLRATFGAQFTEKEGDRLIRIEAGFGKNAETNKRLLNQLLQINTRHAKQAIKDAVSIEDFSTAQAIKDAMEIQLGAGEFFLEDSIENQGEQTQEGQTATGPGGKKIIFRNGQWVPL